MISQDSIEALKTRLDIVDVVSNYIELKKSGANFQARCPFHEENSPSFVVSPQKQIYHCFGCGAGGDSIKFVMEYEKLNYPEAIEKLAQSVNFSLQYDTNTQKKEQSSILEKVSLLYVQQLHQHSEALRYLHERGVSSRSIEHFSVGYAGSSQSTLEFLRKALYSPTQMLEYGVVAQGDRGLYARFIERITFPIHSPNGRLVGFGGRTISGHQAKYVNSSQSAVFNKSKLLYAYHHAKDSIYKQKRIIITEGYLDVIMLHQAGFTNVVATLGTALTSEHLPLLRKSEAEVIMAYDGDSAGRAAARKAATLLTQANMPSYVVLFEGGQDPADMIKAGDIEAVNQLLLSPINGIEFVIDEMAASFDLENPFDKEQALKQIMQFMKPLSAFIKERYQRYIAHKLNVRMEQVPLSMKPMVLKPDEKALTHGSDLQEQSIIKSLLNHENFIDQSLDFLDSAMFIKHHNAYIALLQGVRDDPSLRAINISDAIPVYETNHDFLDELRLFLQAFYLRELQRLKVKNVGVEQLIRETRKLREKIEALKAGNLVPFS